MSYRKDLPAETRITIIEETLDQRQEKLENMKERLDKVIADNRVLTEAVTYLADDVKFTKRTIGTLTFTLLSGGGVVIFGIAAGWFAGGPA